MSYSRKRIVTALLSLGSLVLIWRVHAIIQKYTPTPAVAAAPTGAAVTPSAAEVELKAIPAQDLAPMLESQARLAAQPWGRDPFDRAPFLKTGSPEVVPAVPAAAQHVPAPLVRFTGVSKAGDNWLAALNGQIVRVGDVVQEQYRVTRISNSAVMLRAGEWAFEFSLGAKEPIVRPWVERP